MEMKLSYGMLYCSATAVIRLRAELSTGTPLIESWWVDENMEVLHSEVENLENVIFHSWSLMCIHHRLIHPPE